MNKPTYLHIVGGNSDGIPVYVDPHMDRTQFLVMYEKFWLPPGMINVPFDPDAFIETPEEDIVKKKKDKKLSDVKGIICNCPDEDVDKIIQSLYKEFKQ